MASGVQDLRSARCGIRSIRTGADADGDGNYFRKACYRPESDRQTSPSRDRSAADTAVTSEAGGTAPDVPELIPPEDTAIRAHWTKGWT